MCSGPVTESTATSNRVDHAALLGAALAASVSVAVADGDWEPLESIVGIVLVAVLVAHYPWRQESAKRSAFAVASVTALCGVLIVAPPAEALGLLPGDEWLLLVAWMVLTVATSAWLIRRRSVLPSRSEH